MDQRTDDSPSPKACREMAEVVAAALKHVEQWGGDAQIEFRNLIGVKLTLECWGALPSFNPAKRLKGGTTPARPYQMPGGQ